MTPNATGIEKTRVAPIVVPRKTHAKSPASGVCAIVSARACPPMSMAKIVLTKAAGSAPKKP